MRVASLALCVPLMAGCAGSPVIQTIDSPPPQRLLNPCPRPADRPDAGDDRDLAAWEVETWQRGHDCADRLDAWIDWWRTRPKPKT